MKSAPKVCHFIGAAGSVMYFILGLVLCCAHPSIFNLNLPDKELADLDHDANRAKQLAQIGLDVDNMGILGCMGLFPCSVFGIFTFYVFPIIVPLLLLTRVFAIKAMWFKIVNAMIVGFVMAWTWWNLIGYTMLCCCISCIQETSKQIQVAGTLQQAAKPALEISCCFSCMYATVWLYWASLAIALGSILFCDVCDNDKEVTTEATYGAV